MTNSNNLKLLSGKLSDHFASKANADGKVEDGKIIEDFCRQKVVTCDYISQFYNLNFSMSNDGRIFAVYTV